MGQREYHSLEMDPAAPQGSGQSFYIYHDRDGTTHVVDQKSLIPQGQRDIKHVKLPAASLHSSPTGITPGGIVGMLPPEISSKALEILNQTGQAVAAPLGEHPSVAEVARAALQGAPTPANAAGFKPPDAAVMPMLLTAGVVIGVAWALKPFRAILLKMGMSVVGMWILGTLYIHWIAQSTGMQVAATPSAMVQQAQDSAKQMRKSMEQEQQALDGIH